MNRPRRVVAYNEKELAEKYPLLAKTFSDLMSKSAWVYQKFYPNFCGRYNSAKGKPRRVGIGAILECLEDFGYEIDIIPKKKESR